LDCLAKLRQFVPDLLILDLEMSWGGGDGVLALLCEDSRLVPNRIILMAGGHSEPVLGNRAMPPAVTTLAKPVLLSALLKHAAPSASIGNGLALNGRQRRGILVVDDEFFVRDSLHKSSCKRVDMLPTPRNLQLPFLSSTKGKLPSGPNILATSTVC
jgi:hypothetical protein